jgi:hypothetical protein
VSFFDGPERGLHADVKVLIGALKERKKEVENKKGDILNEVTKGTF